MINTVPQKLIDYINNLEKDKFSKLFHLFFPVFQSSKCISFCSLFETRHNLDIVKRETIEKSLNLEELLKPSDDNINFLLSKSSANSILDFKKKLRIVQETILSFISDLNNASQVQKNFTSVFDKWILKEEWILFFTLDYNCIFSYQTKILIQTMFSVIYNDENDNERKILIDAIINRYNSLFKTETTLEYSSIYDVIYESKCRLTEINQAERMQGVNCYFLITPHVGSVDFITDNDSYLYQHFFIEDTKLNPRKYLLHEDSYSAFNAIADKEEFTSAELFVFCVDDDDTISELDPIYLALVSLDQLNIADKLALINSCVYKYGEHFDIAVKPLYKILKRSYSGYDYELKSSDLVKQYIIENSETNVHHLITGLKPIQTQHSDHWIVPPFLKKYVRNNSDGPDC